MKYVPYLYKMQATSLVYINLQHVSLIWKFLFFGVDC